MLLLCDTLRLPFFCFCKRWHAIQNHTLWFHRALIVWVSFKKQCRRDEGVFLYGRHKKTKTKKLLTLLCHMFASATVARYPK